VPSKLSPSATDYVVALTADEKRTIADRIGDRGSVEPVPGHKDLALVRLRKASADPREAWTQARRAIGDGTQIQPVLLDPEGQAQFPTGEVSVRFHRAVSDDDLDRFAAQHKLRVVRRNEFVPEQIVFEPVESARYLPDVVDELGASDDTRLAWANTIGKYERK
jgi:hypothetical protein